MPTLRSRRRTIAAALTCLWFAGCGETPPPAPPAPVAPAAVAARCPVCGDAVVEERGVPVEVAGRKARVCSNGCAVRFEASPEKFAAK